MLPLHGHLLGHFQSLFSWTHPRTPCPTIQNALPSKWLSALIEHDSRSVPFSKAQQKLPTISIETYRRYNLSVWLTKFGGFELAGQQWKLPISHTDIPHRHRMYVPDLHISLCWDPNLLINCHHDFLRKPLATILFFMGCCVGQCEQSPLR